MRLFSKLLKQGYLVERFKWPFRKFYGRYADLIQQYEVSLSRMLNDILTIDQQWLPHRSDLISISWPWYHAWHSLYYNVWVVSMEHLQRVRHARRERLPLRTPGSVPDLRGLACAVIVETGFTDSSSSWRPCRPWLSLSWEVFMEHLRRVWRASRERVLFRTPGTVPLFGTCLCSNSWNQISRTCRVGTRLVTLNISRYKFSRVCF